MRRKEWYEKDLGEKLLSIVVGFFYGIWFVISRTILLIFRAIRKVTVDVAKTVYGKAIAAIAAIIFAGIIAAFFGALIHPSL